MAIKSKFYPKNPNKYKGDVTEIVARSLWERKCMSYFDLSSSILEWSSEEVIVPYRSPVTGRIHRYFPDFWVKVKNREGKIVEKLIEIKPKYQTVAPKVQSKKTKRYLNEVKTWAVNNWKWNAAKSYCEAKKWDFEIWTEDELKIMI